MLLSFAKSRSRQMRFIILAFDTFVVALIFTVFG